MLSKSPIGNRRIFYILQVLDCWFSSFKSGDWGQGRRWCGKLAVVATWISTLYQSIHLTNSTLHERNLFCSPPLNYLSMLSSDSINGLIKLPSALLTDHLHHFQQNVAMVKAHGLRKWRSEILRQLSRKQRQLQRLQNLNVKMRRWKPCNALAGPRAEELR